ncbi:MAG: sigma-70 family RNA polymerase sigma factor [Planctomycetota bacterium]
MLHTRAARERAAQLAETARQHRTDDGSFDEHIWFVGLHTCAYYASVGSNERQNHYGNRGLWLARWSDIRRFLAERNRGLVFLVVSRFRSVWIESEDLRGEGMLALVRSVDRFDPWRKIRFSTYAYNAIIRSLIRVQRIARHRMGQYPIQDEASIELPTRPPPELWTDRYVEKLRHVLDRNLGELTERESAILDKRFPRDSDRRLTLEEIGTRCRLSKERVRQIQNRALAKLRGVLQMDPSLQ